MCLGRYIFPSSNGFRTRRIGPNTFVKAGAHIDLAEAYTICYIAKHTSIPVPKVQRAWCSNGITYILMDVVAGTELSSAWHEMSQKTKAQVINQLKDYFAQLRALRPPIDGAVTSVIDGPLRDGSRVGLGPFGPFRNHDDFHHFLRADTPLDSIGTLEGGQEIVKAHSQQYRTTFTHGDFAPRNILVKKDGTVTAIIDWDSAGWFPEYWEYTKAKFTPHAPDDWVSGVGEITGKYDEQLAGERRLYTLCGYMLT
jgi:aminoglycoside phosphotransferase